jgi:proteasome lid subunit RPN8/RPN11
MIKNPSPPPPSASGPRQPPAASKQERPRLPRRPVLRFSPTAWAKLVWFCLHGETEIGGFAVTDRRDPLYVTEFVTVKQEADWASVKLDDAAVADFFDRQVDLGRRPEQFARLWCHTHPGDSPTPSGTDEETFARAFGACDWAILFVLARTGKTYARLRFNVGPGGQGDIPVEIDWSRPFAAADHAAWESEYTANIQSRRAQALVDRGTSLLNDGLMAEGKGSKATSSDPLVAEDLGPCEPLGADGLGLLDPFDFESDWADLLATAEWADLEAAAEKVCMRWGLIDQGDWAEAVLSLTPDRQQEFRKEVEAVLANQPIRRSCLMGNLD